MIAETYPAEVYRHLGIAWSPRTPGAVSGKRAPLDRARSAAPLLAWAAATGVAMEGAAEASIRAGFGPTPNGEDPFDAMVGLCGMLNVLLGHRPSGEPNDEPTRRIEGWILGQQAADGWEGS